MFLALARHAREEIIGFCPRDWLDPPGEECLRVVGTHGLDEHVGAHPGEAGRLLALRDGKGAAQTGEICELGAHALVFKNALAGSPAAFVFQAGLRLLCTLVLHAFIAVIAGRPVFRTRSRAAGADLARARAFIGIVRIAVVAYFVVLHDTVAANGP